MKTLSQELKEEFVLSAVRMILEYLSLTFDSKVKPVIRNLRCYLHIVLNAITPHQRLKEKFVLPAI